MLIRSLSGVIWALCFRELLLADSQQQEDNLEATMSLMEDKHKAVMEDMHKLYSQSTKLYEYAYEERVSDRTGSLSPYSFQYTGVLIYLLSLWTERS